MILYMYIASGQGQTLFWCQQKALIILPIFCRFKTNCFEVWIYIHFFMFHHMYRAPCRGRQSIGVKILMTNRKAFSLCPYVASFKMISSKSDFIHIFNDFIHVYSSGARAENPLGTNFWCQQKALITSTICCKLQTNLFEFWFYTHFLMFFYMYIALGKGQTTFVDKILMSTEKPCHFAHLLQVSKEYILKYDFIHNFSCFYIGPGQTTPWGQNFYININLLSLWSFAVSFFHKMTF